MYRHGSYEYLKHVDTPRARFLRSCVLAPGFPSLGGGESGIFREKLDLVLRYMLGDPDVSIEEVTAGLDMDSETAQFLKREVDQLRESADYLGEVGQEVGMEVDELVESALGRVAEFWSNYELLQRISQEVTRLEGFPDKSAISKEGVQDLYQQLQQDFSDSEGILKSIYDNLIPRLERLIQAIEG